MLPDRVSNPGPLTHESGALPIALRSPAAISVSVVNTYSYSLTIVQHSLVHGQQLSIEDKKLLQ